MNDVIAEISPTCKKFNVSQHQINLSWHQINVSWHQSRRSSIPRLFPFQRHRIHTSHRLIFLAPVIGQFLDFTIFLPFAAIKGSPTISPP